MKKEQVAEVAITSYSERGHGVGSAEPGNKKVHVIGGVVGDRLEVALGKKRRRSYHATLKQILTPSACRVKPRCVHVGTCGGCSWQQIAYEAQVAQKERIIRELFDPFLSTATLYPMIPCASPWEYRNKMEFSFSQDKSKQCFLGLNSSHAPGKIIDLTECHITSPWFTRVLCVVKDWWAKSKLDAYHFRHNTGSLRTLTVREAKRTTEKMIMLTVSGSHDHFLTRQQLKSFTQAVLAALPNENPSLFLRIHRVKKGTPSAFYEMHLWGPDSLREELTVHGRTFHFHISPSSFFQPNPIQAEKLFSRAFEIAGVGEKARVYDLYCGAAVGGILFSPHVKKVIGVESNPYAVCDAQRNIEANQVSNLSVIRGDVGEVLAELQVRPDLALIDPPRAGIDSTALKHLLRLAPLKILYLSCHPLTQRENIDQLTEAGYRLCALQPVDQFPHTFHIENIAYLERSPSDLKTGL
ncbi:MAG: 23S rRNA (uracil(1939)-C(5))-methyltransferase RlmD [Chlamydiota bacterium]